MTLTAHPAWILSVLLTIEGLIVFIDSRAVGKKLFGILPSMFWIYTIPMLAHSAGILPAQSAVYNWITAWVLPAALTLLLLSADIGGIVRLGPAALTVMAAAAGGILLGGPAAMLLMRPLLPDEAWKAMGPLCGSWIGGSFNMIAVKEAVGTPDDLFGLIILTDTLMAYAWMALLIALAAHQNRFDRWNGSRISLLYDLTARSRRQSFGDESCSRITGVVTIGIIAAVSAAVSVWAGRLLPSIQGIINPAVWSVVLATLIGIGLSFTQARRLQTCGSSRAGFLLLYLVLASIGAKTSLSYVGNLPVFLAVGTVWIFIHAACLLAAARFMKAPLALLASASQACIGGTASAPVTAGIYHPQLAPVGLLMAVLGNIIGTFLGLLSAHLCRWLWQLA